jgi:hypothetical protein
MGGKCEPLLISVTTMETIVATGENHCGHCLLFGFFDMQSTCRKTNSAAFKNSEFSKDIFSTNISRIGQQRE